MKTEEFDDEIRRKIERLNFSPQEKDIDRVLSHIKAHQPPSFWDKFGKPLMYSVAASILVSSIIYNLTQQYREKTLLQTLHSVTQQRDSLQNHQSFQMERKVDTVYLTQYIKTPQNISSNLAENKGQSVAIEQEKSIEKGSENKVLGTSEELKTVKNISEFSQDVITQNTDNQIVNNKSSNEKVNLNDLDISENQKIDRLNFDEKELKNKDILAIENHSFLEKNPTIYWAKKRNIATPKQHKFFSSFDQHNITFRTGLGTELTDDLWGAGISGEALLGKHWGLSLGLKMQYSLDDNYDSDANYKVVNGDDFRQKYAPKVANNDEIMNITIVETLYTLPVHLSYYQPLRHNFWLFGSVGTTIDIYGIGNASYDLRNSANEYNKGKNQTKLTIVPFNNVQFLAGIEKRIKHFDFQISPILSTQFKTVNYREQHVLAGGQFKFFYHF